eukprot:SM000311S11922  [mRNA]  locus=s311:92275:94402:+ [translate_table: standard]
MARSCSPAAAAKRISPVYLPEQRQSASLLPAAAAATLSSSFAPSPAISQSPAPKTHGLVYNGGPIVYGPLNVYILWYGNWSAEPAKQIVRDFITLYDSLGNHVSGQVALKGEAVDSYSFGTQISDAQVFRIIAGQIIQGKLPLDTSAVYLVLGSEDVVETSGFCTNYCGWHDVFYFISTLAKPVKSYFQYITTIVDAKAAKQLAGFAGETLAMKMAFIGNAATQCPDACIGSILGGFQASPNGNVGVDGMISVIGHELAESVTDPVDGSGWTDGPEEEVGDLCIWQFSTAVPPPVPPTADFTGGAAGRTYEYNLVGVNSRKFLVQLLFDPFIGAWGDGSYGFYANTADITCRSYCICVNGADLGHVNCPLGTIFFVNTCQPIDNIYVVCPPRPRAPSAVGLLP